MTEITFLRPVHHYDSYGDFYRLAELAGFPIRSMDMLDISEPGVFITAPPNGDMREHLDSQAGKPVNAHLIVWNLERPSGSAGAVGKYAQENRMLLYGQRWAGKGELVQGQVRYADEVWVSDRQMAAETELRYVPVGSHPGLGEPRDDKLFDIVHMSYTNPRRQTIYKHFDKPRVAPNCWPPERDEVLARSKLALNVHQDNHSFQEPLRFALFAAYGLPILSETLIDAYPYGDDVMHFAPYDELYLRAERLLQQDYAPLREMGLKCRHRMTVEMEFGRVVREAVQQSVGNWR